MSPSPGPSPCVVRVADDPADREACFAVRKEVFVVEQRVPEDLEYDAYDAGAVHVLAVREDGQPLGAARLLYGEAASAKTGGEAGVGSLGRLAVVRAARGLGVGVGVALVRGVEDVARARGLTAVDLHAQTHALGFYERLGYVAYGPEFPDAGIPHRAMRRSLQAFGRARE
ncbi:GNAT family N-acetyltransferase [Streptomyces sp. NPDC020707]|uniref:GNAT family N-acetyltransferase n=1 Tax=Streptomyces sp. NPDC020707 TaxID=3365084 RepID=UPI0037A47581